MLLSPFERPRIQPVFKMPHAQLVLSPHWPCLDVLPIHLPSLPMTASRGTFSSKAPVSSPRPLSAERRHARFSKKIKATRSEFPSCGPQVCLRLCPPVACDSLHAPRTPSCLISLPPLPRFQTPPFAFSIFGEILNGFCLMMTHLGPGEIFLSYFS